MFGIFGKQKSRPSPSLCDLLPIFSFRAEIPISFPSPPFLAVTLTTIGKLRSSFFFNPPPSSFQLASSPLSSSSSRFQQDANKPFSVTVNVQSLHRPITLIFGFLETHSSITFLMSLGLTRHHHHLAFALLSCFPPFLRSNFAAGSEVLKAVAVWPGHGGCGGSRHCCCPA